MGCRVSLYPTSFWCSGKSTRTLSEALPFKGKKGDLSGSLPEALGLSCLATMETYLLRASRTSDEREVSSET